MRLVAGAATDVGRVREGNEDSYLVDDGLGLFAVADGMGGHRAGEVASATALEALRAAVTSGRPIREAIEDANDAVFEKSLADDRLRGMGTTITAGTLAAGGTLILGHVGDSRAYLLHDGELRRVTTDHSLVEELVRDGRLTAEEAAVHPQRSIITRALGVDESVDVDVYAVELQAGDRVLFCSDGLTGMVGIDDIAAELRREPDPVRAARHLVDAANAAGGEDNITVVIADATDEAAPASPPGGVAVDGDGALAAAPPAAAATTAALEEPTPSRQGERSTWRRVRRVALWVVPVLVVLGLAFGAVAWYARRGYFVAFDRGTVTVYRGVPGGLLGFDPTVDRHTRLRPKDLSQAHRVDVSDRQRFSSRSEVDAFLSHLRADAATTTTTTTIPTTTVPPTTAAATTAPPA
jgi:serine/threonine protein phosphatase PrpC